MITRLLLAVALFCAAPSCGGGGSAPAVAVSPPVAVSTVPLFDAYSTDLRDPEGTVAQPLELAFSPNCVFGGTLPECSGQVAAFAFARSNAAATTADPNRWRVIVNVEDAWQVGCNDGPPNQSWALTDPRLVWQPSGLTTIFGFDLASETVLCIPSTIPYVGVQLLRGVQGDPQPRVAAWGERATVAFYERLDSTAGPSLYQQLHFWVHLRDPATGERFMAHAFLWDSGGAPDYFGYTWNWPIVHSDYFVSATRGIPLRGGRIKGVVRAGTPCDVAQPLCANGKSYAMSTRRTPVPFSAGPITFATKTADVLDRDVPFDCSPFVVPSGQTQGSTKWTVDVEGFADCRFPGIGGRRPDVLGIEIAVEGTYTSFALPTGARNLMRLTLTGVGITKTK